MIVRFIWLNQIDFYCGRMKYKNKYISIKYMYGYECSIIGNTFSLLNENLFEINRKGLYEKKFYTMKNESKGFPESKFKSLIVIKMIT